MNFPKPSFAEAVAEAGVGSWITYPVEHEEDLPPPRWGGLRGSFVRTSRRWRLFRAHCESIAIGGRLANANLKRSQS